jgi:hypothetical protein
MRLALVTLSLDSKRSPDFTRVLNILGLDGFTAQLANRLAEQSIVLLWSLEAQSGLRAENVRARPDDPRRSVPRL